METGPSAPLFRKGDTEGLPLWVAAERLPMFHAVFPELTPEPHIAIPRKGRQNRLAPRRRPSGADSGPTGSPGASFHPGRGRICRRGNSGRPGSSIYPGSGRLRYARPLYQRRILPLRLALRPPKANRSLQMATDIQLTTSAWRQPESTLPLPTQMKTPSGATAACWHVSTATPWTDCARRSSPCPPPTSCAS